MGRIFTLRDLVEFPSGDNSTDVLINGVHFNRTALNIYNYTLYDNGTLSNKSHCYLVFGKYKPHMFSNGSFVGGTSCYEPYYSIRTRGWLGIIFACIFALTIVLSMINLRKHGRKFLPDTKRFRPVGRRWQWYWMLFVAVSGCISGFMAIDVDRDYLQSIAIAVQSFFFYLMMPGLLAACWEAVRHWGSWRERQIVDRDSSLLKQGDRRSKIEFYNPLVFYLLDFLAFFMIIPRPWGDIEKQRSQWQALHYAAPQATDGRFKAGGILLVITWCIVVYVLFHNLHYYSPPKYKNAPIQRFFDYTPFKFLVALPFALVPLGYIIAAAWTWRISPMKYNGDSGYIYGFGYAPVAFVLIVFNIAGYDDPNEDRALIEQRLAVDKSTDAELGVVRKPGWWNRTPIDAHLSNEQRLKNLTTEIGGGKATTANIQREMEDVHLPSWTKEMEMNNESPSSSSDRQQTLSSDEANEVSNQQLSVQRPQASRSTTSTLVNVKPQKIKSMLDV